MSLAKTRNEQESWEPGEHSLGASPSFEALARAQGVRPVERLEDLLGGWPEEERTDGFEQAVRRWRQEDD